MCAIDPTLKYRRSATCHSPSCSCSNVATMRTSEARLGKIPNLEELAHRRGVIGLREDRAHDRPNRVLGALGHHRVNRPGFTGGSVR
jgi:hypothetical protein